MLIVMGGASIAVAVALLWWSRPIPVAPIIPDPAYVAAARRRASRRAAVRTLRAAGTGAAMPVPIAADEPPPTPAPWAIPPVPDTVAELVAATEIARSVTPTAAGDAGAADPVARHHDDTRRDDEAWERIFGMLRPSEDDLARARAAHGSAAPRAESAPSAETAPSAPARRLSVVPSPRSTGRGARTATATSIRRCGVCREPGHDRRRCPASQAS